MARRPLCMWRSKVNSITTRYIYINILPACDTLDKACLRISSSAVIFQTVGTFVVYEAPTVHAKVKGELDHHKVCKHTMSCINLATQHICPDTESLWSLLHLGPHVHIKGETTGHIYHIVSSLPPHRYIHGISHTLTSYQYRRCHAAASFWQTSSHLKYG